MILTSLKDLAFREGLLENADYEPKPVRWGINLGENGEFLGLLDNVSESGPKKKPQAILIMVPRQAVRTGTKPLPYFLVDVSAYVLGFEPETGKNPQELFRRSQLFAEQIRRAYEKTTLDTLRAVLTFLDNEIAVKECASELVLRTYSGSDRLAFRFRGEWIQDAVGIKEYWASTRTPDGKSNQCTVCGEIRQPAKNHPWVPVPGGGSRGVPLVSFNKDAFESYGWSGNENAPVCVVCTDAYTTALKRSLSEGYRKSDGEKLSRRSIRLNNNTTAVYWADSSSEIVDLFASIFSEPRPEAVRELLSAAFHGLRPARLGAQLYCLLLSGRTGRATVCGYHSGSLESAERSVFEWFRLATVEGRPVPLIALLRSLAVLGKYEKLPSNLAIAVYLSIVFSRPLPRWVLHAALLRSRAEKKVSKERAILLAAYLSRTRGPERKEIGMSLDPENREVAYLLGRLLAKLERLQQDAQGGKKSSVNRYFAAASTRPIAVFPAMIRLAQHHLRKLRPALANHINREVGELVAGIARIPASLATPQQAEFALGYYHQREFRPAPKSESEETQKEIGNE